MVVKGSGMPLDVKKRNTEDDHYTQRASKYTRDESDQNSTAEGGTTSDTPAADAVWAIPELAEAIFEQVYFTTDMVRCKAVCHHWRSIIKSTASKIIRRKLFLEADPASCDIVSPVASHVNWIATEVALDDGISARERPYVVFHTRIPPRNSGPKRTSVTAMMAVNPAIPTTFTYMKTCHPASAEFRIRLTRLAEILEADKDLGTSFICQPPVPSSVFYASQSIPARTFGDLLTLDDLSKAFIQVEADLKHILQGDSLAQGVKIHVSFRRADM